MLGLTLLAWGNSAGDLMTGLGLARRGLGNVAMTACFAGPSFNLLIGLGTGILLLLQRQGSRSEPLALPFDFLVGAAFLLANCAAVVGVSLVCGRRLPRAYGFVAFVLYGLYLTFSLALILRLT